jgi:hypothetical protein
MISVVLKERTLLAKRKRGSMMNIWDSCKGCRFYMPTGKKNSGIYRPDGRGKWFYGVGKCKHPEPFIQRDNIPEWASCHLFKRRRFNKRSFKDED